MVLHTKDEQILVTSTGDAGAWEPRGDASKGDANAGHPRWGWNLFSCLVRAQNWRA